MKKTFVLGVGAPKTGTTWLHSYLSESDFCNLGCLKEYHVWDAMYIGSCHDFKTRLRDFKPTRAFFVRFMMQNFDGFYEHYFNSIISGSVHVTGDITPAYCGLSEGNLSRLKARLERAGFVVKIIFLMRDPVDRCWSAARMEARNRAAKGDILDEGGVKDIFHRKFKTEKYIFRTRYDLTIKNISNVFSGEDIYFGIYEEMFEPESIKKLSNFVGIDYLPSHMGVIKNASPSDAILDEFLADECYQFYIPTYEFCREKFPRTKVLWRS